ncbi:hypothetical protein ABZ260_24760 [Streptosporangium sp. NPDC006013]|uniref:hypothetical protein n=1 Tax=Streptosporangium sp. NPDC006013 TaxID=3155596 RepID=UPI0033BA503F
MPHPVTYPCESSSRAGQPPRPGRPPFNTVTIAINPNFPRPLLYAAISGSYNIVGSLIVSAILLAI